MERNITKESDSSTRLPGCLCLKGQWIPPTTPKKFRVLWPFGSDEHRKCSFVGVVEHQRGFLLRRCFIVRTKSTLKLTFQPSPRWFSFGVFGVFPCFQNLADTRSTPRSDIDGGETRTSTWSMSMKCFRGRDGPNCPLGRLNVNFALGSQSGIGSSQGSIGTM